MLPGPSNPRLDFVHIPTPGTRYTPATGAAIITVIHNLTRYHEAAGHPTRILVRGGGTIEYPTYPIGEVVEILRKDHIHDRRIKAVDAALGLLIKSRPFGVAPYHAAGEYLTPSFAGTLFAYNAPGAIPPLRRQLPQAHLVLYAQNQLFNSYSRRELRHVLNNLDTLICVSHFIANDVKARAGLDSPKVKVVHNGADTHTFTPAANRPDGDPIILFVGRVHPTKGPDLLLKAAALIAAPQRPFKVRIVGSSKFRANRPLSAYEQSLRELAVPITDRVEFSPFTDRNHIVAQYHRATVFAAPSNWDDPFPLTVTEALASGLPCVASNRGGIPEVGNSIRYFDPPDVRTLANHLAEILDNDQIRAEMAVKSRQRALEIGWDKQYALLCEAIGIPQ